jgi:type IV pilus assembly protein PilY1
MKKTLLILLMCLGLIHKQIASAEDIDLFLGTPPGTTEVPNVLIILDNTANWNTPFDNEKAALISVFNSLPIDKFRVGLMMFTETGNPNNNVDGGYVRAAIRLMDATNKPRYSNLINGLNKNDDKSNGGKAGLTMAEAYYYFKGAAPRSGNNKVKTDYTGNTASGAYLANSRAVWELPGNALPSFTGTPYNSPVIEGCAKNFIIYISNGAVQDNNSDISTATTLLSNAGGNTTTIPISPSGSQNNVADEWARFMKSSPLGITTYTVDVNKVTNGQGPGWTALLKSMANVSGGKYFDVSSANNAGAEISAALNKIFTEILAVNSVFASASLPTTANTQNKYLNQVYIGVFRPDADAYPRWPGNLKQYRIGASNDSLDLLDADGQIATNSTTGFITECARSYWTPSTVDTYWSFKPQGDCLAVANSSISNYPDGNIVEKGAQAYLLRSSSTRNVKTCSPTFASCTSLTNFDTSNAAITQALLNSGGSDRDTLINWARGVDNADENLNGNLTEFRPSIHGDVIHGRPTILNYGTDDAPQTVVYYGGNDGILRAVNGNRDGISAPLFTSNPGNDPGEELWSFVPPEHYSNIKRLRDNTTQISFPGNTSGTLPKPYGFDAPITAFEGTISGVAKKFIYAPMRRGGRALYAFDVTSPTSPTLKWKIGCPNQTNDTDCTAGFSGIGQTWATPEIVYSTGYNSGNSPMLIMGGGYDTCEDTDNGTINYDSGTVNTACATVKGNKVYVIDANTGSLLKTFTTDRSVIADIKVSADSGKIQYAYVVDLGGNIYRISALDAAPASWTMTKIASLGCDTIAPCNANRKFMFGPSVVKNNNAFYLMVGSGDREKPITSYTATTSVTNYFFMVIDQPADATWLSDEGTNCGGASVLCLNSLLAITTDTPTDAELSTKKGWYLALSDNEQIVTSALTLSNIVYFSSHIPAVPTAGSCGNNLGTAKSYAINYKNANSIYSNGIRYQYIAGGGLSPSPVAGTVRLDDGTEADFCFGCGNGNSDDGGGTTTYLNPEPPKIYSDWTQPKSRVYWYIEQ